MLAQDGESHTRFVGSALTTRTTSVEAQLKEQAQRTHQEQVTEISRGVEVFATRMVEQKWQEW
eukprot:480356-Prorocentrum_lima.AAC.1